MRILITGAAGNIGSQLAFDLLESPHHLHLMFHQTALPQALQGHPQVSAFQSDLGHEQTLDAPCRGVDCIVHCAGELFKPFPESFLWKTNVVYVQNLIAAAVRQRVGKIILVSFPHVEGETTPESPASGSLEGNPVSNHAKTRMVAERHLFRACQGANIRAIVLRAGMIYGPDILMMRAAKWLLQRRLLGVWREPTWIHILSLPDFQRCVRAAIEWENAEGIYNLGDERPLTLQSFLDRLAEHWGFPKPWRAPMWSFYCAAMCIEVGAWFTRRTAPLTRDFIRIGRASYVADTTRMKSDLIARLTYPTFDQGIMLL